MADMIGYDWLVEYPCENKTCWTCKFREIDSSLKPCADCEDILHDFTVYSNWEKHEN